MKVLAILLSFYIFGLNLAPCADNDVPNSEAQTEITESFDNDHQHQDSDLCSPFCICQCCHINATHYQFANLKLDNTYNSTQIFFCLSGLEKDFTTSILQPPRA